VPTDPSGPTLPQPWPQGRHILVVDDEPLIAMMIQDALEDAGGVVTVAHDAATALAAASQQPGAGHFDALVVNVGLPDLSGDEVIARLRAARASLPVLIVTASAPATTDGRPVRIPGSGPTAVLSKPFDPLLLAGAVADLIAEAERGTP
jgi:CheY-like chemotaxis protein